MVVSFKQEQLDLLRRVRLKNGKGKETRSEMSQW